MPLSSLSRRVLAALAMVGATGGIAGDVEAREQPIFFQIATGGVDGTYYPLGAVIANAISRPPGSRPCDDGGSCGVEALIASVQTSTGSVDNVAAVQAGRVTSAFAQADIVDAAFRGEGPFKGKPAMAGLRALTQLYPEVLQVIARPDAGIARLADMIGKKVSLDEPGSGLLVMARDVLAAHGLKESQMTAFYLKAGPALDLMAKGELDALFHISGLPSPLIAGFAEARPIRILSLEPKVVVRLLAKHRFLTRHHVAAETYAGVPAFDTISVGSQWIVSADLPERLVYEICRSLWHPSTQRLLAEGHPQGGNVTLERALDGISIPLHPGAERCYRELGALR